MPALNHLDSNQLKQCVDDIVSASDDDKLTKRKVRDELKKVYGHSLDGHKKQINGVIKEVIKARVQPAEDSTVDAAKVRALLGSPDEQVPVEPFTMQTRVDARAYYYLKSLDLKSVKNLRACGEGKTTMVEQNEIFEAKQAFLKLPMHRDGGQVIVNVPYKPPKDGFPGRLWSPLSSLWGPFRSLLLKDTTEADMACCMQVCIRMACRAFGIKCPHLKQYTRSKADRERVLQAYMDAHGGCTRGAAKDAYQMALTSMHAIKNAKGVYKAFDAEAKRIQNRTGK